MAGEYCLIYSTHPSLEQARATARHLLDAGLVACCNILPPIESHYCWQGAYEQTSEIAMVCKTAARHAQQASQAIAAMHPYDCPAVAILALQDGYPPFLQWIDQQTSPIA